MSGWFVVVQKTKKKRRKRRGGKEVFCVCGKWERDSGYGEVGEGGEGAI